jgi:chromosome condensin MukBEF ATPase and DNA-binding subunit MukB
MEKLGNYEMRKMRREKLEQVKEARRILSRILNESKFVENKTLIEELREITYKLEESTGVEWYSSALLEKLQEAN